MYKKFIKRIIDIVLASIALPIFGLILIFVSLLIYFEDEGPVFYNPLRIGQNGKLFKMYKFRSMKVNAPDIRIKDGSTFNSETDPRVTKIGKFIRERSIDEIPQVLNVLKGDMSCIGPRPDPPDWLDRYGDNDKVFLKVKPGVTGYSQAYFRNSVDGKEKIKNDIYYAINISFFFDLKIFFKTTLNVFKRENMYKTGESTDKEQSINN